MLGARKIANATLTTGLVICGMAIMPSPPMAAPQHRAPAGACAADIRQKCSGVEPGEGRIVACVKAHFGEFSEPCQARLAKVAAVAKACAPDVKQNCSGMKGHGRIRACIKEVLANVSDTCKQAVAQSIAGKK